MERVVADADLDPPWLSCPVCGVAAETVFELRLQADPVVDLVRCTSCGGSSATRMPTADFCARLYETSYAAEHVATTQDNAASFAAHLLTGLAKLKLRDELRLLDFGGNDGSMALALGRALLATDRVRQVSIVTIDHVKPRSSDDRRIRVQAVNSLDLLPRDSVFDGVLASAVVEHIPYVAALLSQLLSRVADNGWFYARTPWVAPLVRRWRALPLMLWPVHVHDLGRAFWNGVSLRTPSMRIVRSRPSWVETSWRRDPLRTAAAHVLKLPARIDARIRPSYRGRIDWPFVGGWEVLLSR